MDERVAGTDWIQAVDVKGNNVCVNLARTIGIARSMGTGAAAVIMLGPGMELPLRSPGFETLRQHVGAAKLIELPRGGAS
jgi:hypothetical protein